jgi:hypothetical protein
MQSEGIHMELKVLYQHGWSIRKLAREFGLNWRTVKREVTSDNPRHYPERVKPTTLTAAQHAHSGRRLAVCPTIRGTDLHHELRRDCAWLPTPLRTPNPDLRSPVWVAALRCETNSISAWTTAAATGDARLRTSRSLRSSEPCRAY